MYLYIHTDLSDSRSGFRFRYSMGCDLSLEMANGTLVSPGFDMENYPHNLECNYHLRGPAGRPVSLRFLQFGLDDSDNVEIYDGSTSNGVPLHPPGGFKGFISGFSSDSATPPFEFIPELAFNSAFP